MPGLSSGFYQLAQWPPFSASLSYRCRAFKYVSLPIVCPCYHCKRPSTSPSPPGRSVSSCWVVDCRHQCHRLHWGFLLGCIADAHWSLISPWGLSSKRLLLNPASFVKKKKSLHWLQVCPAFSLFFTATVVLACKRVLCFHSKMFYLILNG